MQLVHTPRKPSSLNPHGPGRARGQRRRAALPLLLAVGLATGCGDGGTADVTAGGDPGTGGNGGNAGDPPVAGAGYALLKSDSPRDTAPAASSEEQQATVRGARDFAWDLYHELQSEGENSFFSPYSISTALAMAYAGAAGDTRTQMAQALHFEQPDATLHAGYNALDLALDSRNLPATDEVAGLTLNVQNAVWASEDDPPKDPYLDTLAVNYGTGVYAVDFAGDPEGAREAINQAVYGWTNELIEDLIPQGSIDNLTRMVLTNSIYLYAPWNFPFSEGATQPQPFFNLDGTESQVDTMREDQHARYADVDGVQVVALPYRGGDMEMLFLMPPDGEFAGFEATLDTDTLNALSADASSKLITLYLPKFSIDGETVSLVTALKAMGMTDAFDENLADFSPIMDGPLFIGDVLHQAFLDVAEQGTEAAAATAVIFQGESAGPQPEAEVHLDHPFVFAIRDVPTQAVLFMGRILKL